MNPYKPYKLIFQLFLWGVSVAIGIAILFPIISFYTKPSTSLQASIQVSEENTGFNWLIENEKIDILSGVKSNFLFVDKASSFNSNFMNNIGDNTLIAEMLYSQFGGNQQQHDYLNHLFEGNYTGYIGKTCLDLSDREDVPSAILSLYESNNDKTWDFYGKGIVLSNEENVIVLKEGVDYTGDLMVSDGRDAYVYTGYFELVDVSTNTSAYFDLDITEKGQILLEDAGLSLRFSAELKVSNRVFDGLYHCGAFSKVPVTVPSGYENMATIMKNKGIYDDQLSERLYWQWYYPNLLNHLYHVRDVSPYYKKDMGDQNIFRADENKIYIHKNGKESVFFMKGVNLGAALPGKNFTEFPMDKSIYLGWLEQMSQLNINTLRTYTLLPPVFYQALYEFNDGREDPIYLLQEIWPEEYPEDHNYLGKAYNESYQREIEYMVHAIHGNINIPVREYRAYGVYSYDVSPYLIGYLVGREMEPLEVQATDELNKGYMFKGHYLYGFKNASPTEAWLAESCDYALGVEEVFYGDKPLVAIVSWPTLDPKSHDSEWSTLTRKEKKFNDNTVVDINNIGINKSRVTGFFGAYHIYPNYPDFMNNELSYDSYEDDQGRFRYGGYLKEFMAGHKNYPAVVAEYGISTSQVTAHISPDGYDHGGLSEEDQALGIIRMTDAIIREEYAGAIIFEWMDEWAKKTWTTEPYMIPYHKNPFWHNVLDPEQNYGLLAVESKAARFMEDSHNNSGIRLGQNAAYVFVEVDDDLFGENSHLTLGINTVKEGLSTSTEHSEFLLKLGTTSELLVNPGYNWLDGHYSAVSALYEAYEPLIQLTNGENTSMFGDYVPEKSINLSKLNYGEFSNPRNTVYYDGDKWHVRLAYGLLGIADPSDNMVLYDKEEKRPVTRDQIKVTSIDDIEISVLGEKMVTYTFPLTKWSKPNYQERKKLSFTILADYFKSL